MNERTPDALDPVVKLVALPSDAPETVVSPEFNPISALMRLMRGRWLVWFLLCCGFGSAFGYLGYINGTVLYETQAIIRIYPKEQTFLYKGDEIGGGKAYDNFLKAETTYVAGYPVMSRAYETLSSEFPDQLDGATVQDLSASVEIQRKDSLIVLKTKSKSPEFAEAKLDAITGAYLSLTAENKARQTASRSETLRAREAELLDQLSQINRQSLEAGGEFGPLTLVKAHNEKIAQIDATAARKAEVEATLTALRETGGNSSADMNDEEIMRATLLDRALADLNFEKARHEATLSTLLKRYSENSRQVQDIKGKIAVIDQAMQDRRTQIQVLGQTGALTDQSAGGEEDSVAAIEDLLQKVTERLETQRAEARDLNERRVTLDFLEDERAEVADMLAETRTALDAVHLESEAALPGLIDLMEEANLPLKPAEDSSMLLALGGATGGGLFATLIVMVIGASSGRLRFSDDLWNLTYLVPILGAVDRKVRRNPLEYERAINKLRNRIKLVPARVPKPTDRGRILSIGRLDKGSTPVLAKQLAKSFAATRMRVLLVDADMLEQGITEHFGLGQATGWSDLLLDREADAVEVDGLWIMPNGPRGVLDDADIGLYDVNAVLADLAREWDVVLVHFGSLTDNVAAELVLTATDFCLAHVVHGDRLTNVRRHGEATDKLPRNGGGIWLEKLKPSDPYLAS